MFRKVILAICICAVAIVGGAVAFGQDAATLAAALDKNKYKKKDKSKNGINVSVEVYLDIKNVPSVKEPSAYSGHYADEYGGFWLDLKVAADGTAEGSGTDTLNDDPEGKKVGFTLSNARVREAVLTAEKLFADGRKEHLDAVFVNRTTVEGTNANNITNRSTKFGLGFIQSNGEWTNRVFLAKK